MSARQFIDAPAVREKVPLLVGLVGPSGSGKSYSMLRLASGIQSVYGGDIFAIDTEAKRLLHYADKFKFRHVPFSAPFSPGDYEEAIKYCLSKGAKTICVDSFSHEHAGQGGVLEMHDAEIQRMAGDNADRAGKVSQLAWQKPKAARAHLLNTILQAPCNFLFSFRAKEKLKMVRGQEPTQLGWMPIGGDEYWFEMTTNILLEPNSGGVPTWKSSMPGETMVIKLPEQFRAGVFPPGKPLDEETGAKLAQWAAGGAAPSGAAASVLKPGATTEVRGSPKTKWSVEHLAMFKAITSLGEHWKAPTQQLEYMSWTTGDTVTDPAKLTPAEVQLVTDRAVQGEVPNG